MKQLELFPFSVRYLATTDYLTLLSDHSSAICTYLCINGSPSACEIHVIALYLLLSCFYALVASFDRSRLFPETRYLNAGHTHERLATLPIDATDGHTL